MPHSRRKPPRQARRRRHALLTVLGLVLIGAAASVWSLHKGLHSDSNEPQSQILPEPVRLDYCTLTATPLTELKPEQAGNAAIIALVAQKRGLPARAVSIALATAFQESRLRNISYGDRDSLGLFQQRPSQGWGTRKQITDPVYATNAFYDALTKVRGYQSMSITKAAQKVQRSAFPDAYATYGQTAELLSPTLRGHSPARLTCLLPPSTASPQTARRTGVTGRAAAMRAAAAKETGAGSTRVISPTTISFRVPASTAHRRAWALAQWAVARADALDVVEVRVAGRVWDRSRPTEGWRKASGRPRSGVTIRVA